MKHVDLFSGIGGFSLACEWAGVETVGFVEIDKFCQKILNKHWPEVPIIEDINNAEEITRIIENAISQRTRCELVTAANKGWPTSASRSESIRQGNGSVGTGGVSATDQLLLTGGFPCQPFSNAGRKRGSSDDRYLWPQTLAVIEAIKPDWIILENVPGILNMVFPDSEVGVASQATLFGVENDEICDYSTISGGIERDLRQAGYETVWMVIPACSLSAPHRRDRVWIVANKQSARQLRKEQLEKSSKGKPRRGTDDLEQKDTVFANAPNPNRSGNRTSQSRVDREGEEGNKGQNEQSQFGDSRQDSYASNPDNTSPSRYGQDGRLLHGITEPEGLNDSIRIIPGWEENWYEVATRVCTMDDGISNGLVRPKGWRVNALKAAGNAIVPQVAYQLIKNIVEIENDVVTYSTL